MLFSSITFLYFFLPLTVFFYYMVPKKAKNLVLFVMSVLFYAWGEPVYVLLMLAEIAAAYGLTIAMQRLGDSLAGRVFYALSVLFPFVLLFYFKFSPSLPIGISFYTFQIVSYCIDVRRGRVELQKSLLKLATYVTLFPQLVAGPIVRYEDVAAVIDGTDSEDGSGARNKADCGGSEGHWSFQGGGRASEIKARYERCICERYDECDYQRRACGRRVYQDKNGGL